MKTKTVEEEENSVSYFIAWLVGLGFFFKVISSLFI